MSHLLANPAQRPYLFELPRSTHPLTPPDTDNDFLGTSYSSAPPPPAPAIDTESATHVPPTEIPTPFHRKPVSVAYVNSAPRDARERLPHRSSIRWLVVVIPPASFSREHGHFGHTLATGAPNRLSQGILMPLFPTLGSQLSAIAREFSLPSTTGLCLYLQTTLNGVTLYPRISDDSWHMLWAHLFEARSPSPAMQQLPISGQIEFDIDLSKARWYDAWLSTLYREYADVPHSVAHSRHPSMTHWRGDSRTSFMDEQVDDQLDSISVAQLPAARGGLYAPRVPKRLSLVERFEASSAVPGSRPSRHLSPHSHSPPDEAQMRNMLSPIVQEEEPKTARKDIDTLVHSWRATASAAHSPLAATGQTSLDPANMPNTVRDLLLASTPDAPTELNLDDYAWSVSSAGPPDYENEDAESVVWRLPSPDIARRVLSDVPPTPATATSWGAPLSYPPSPLEEHSFCAPSIDLAGRVMYSRPATPTTATSWGPPSYPASPLGHQLMLRAPSPDLAARGMLSVPPTPSTATSWGAPSPLPASPAHSEFRVPSPDLAARALLSAPTSPLPMRLRRFDGSSSGASAPADTVPQFEHESPDHPPLASELVFPYYRALEEVWAHVWPYTAGREAQHRPSDVSRLIFPYYGARHPTPTDTPHPWDHVWPYQRGPTGFGAGGIRHGENSAPLDSSVDSARRTQTTSHYPYLNLYPTVYPHFDIYPPAVHVKTRFDTEKGLSLSCLYPVLTIYRAVYPHFDIYPAVLREETHKQAVSSSETYRPVGEPIQLQTSQYPDFTLYPPVYPWNLQGIYPTGKLGSHKVSATAVNIHLSAAYPWFDLYPSVYPHNLEHIYPPASFSSSEDSSPSSVGLMALRLPVLYPQFDLYPAIYPSIVIYPAVHTAGEDITQQAWQEPSLRATIGYPFFNIYPAMYPYNLANIYPAQASRGITDYASQPSIPCEIDLKLSTSYPVVEPYPPVYPWNVYQIYPAIMTGREVIQKAAVAPVVLNASYPNLEIYAPVYPWNVYQVYPEGLSDREVVVQRATMATMTSVTLKASYPNLKIYAPVYPHNMERIYPRISGASVQLPPNITLPVLYPAIQIYAAVYPHNLEHVYPSSGLLVSNAHRRSSNSVPDRMPISMTISQNGDYPYIRPYPSVYPSLIIYPEPAAARVVESISINMGSKAAYYPLLEIYPPIYPYLQIYPSVWTSGTGGGAEWRPTFTPTALNIPTASRHRPRFSHGELHQQVFGLVPSNENSVPLNSHISPTRMVQDKPGSSHLRTRSRSGTVSNRPMPPPKPIEMTNGRTPGGNLGPAGTRTSALPTPRRPLSTMGLPVHPAANRRVPPSLTRPFSSTSSILPTVHSPDAMGNDGSHDSMSRHTPGGSPNKTRPISRLNGDASPTANTHISQSVSATLLPKVVPPHAGGELHRSKTLPGSKAVGSPKRASVVLQKAKVFDQASAAIPDDQSQARISMATLSQFPVPPRPSLPPLPGSRPVAKLDRSKYPFA